MTVNSITIAGYVMHGGAHGDGWYFSDLIDWSGVTASKSSITERPQADGSFGNIKDYRESAAVSVNLFYASDSTVEALLAVEQFLGAVGSGDSVEVSMTDELRTTSRVVSVRNAIPEDNHGQPVIKVPVDMIAYDPLRYGLPVSVSTGPPVSGGGLKFPLGSGTSYWDFGPDGSSGRVSVTNSGTAATWPELTVRGGVAEGFIVANVSTGQSIRFDRVIPAGRSVTVDQRTQTALLDGSPVGGFITESGWFQIPAGATHLIQFSPLGDLSGSPLLTVTMRPAFR